MSKEYTIYKKELDFIYSQFIDTERQWEHLEIINYINSLEDLTKNAIIGSLVKELQKIRRE